MKENPFITHDYEEKQQARKERLEERAERATERSNQAFQKAKEIGDPIPLGQPILVGHHSERRHRRAIEKIDNAMRNSVEEEKKAKYLSQRANGVGTAGISSTDPEALRKLKEKLEGLEKLQQQMKDANRILRNKKRTNEEKLQDLVEYGFSKAAAKAMMVPDYANRIGFAPYQLSNNNQTIGNTKKRIADLERLHNCDQVLEVETEDYHLFVNNGYVVLDFKAGKPSEKIRAIAKRYAFKWSRYQTAWVRKVTPNALAAAHTMAQQLNKEFF